MNRNQKLLESKKKLKHGSAALVLTILVISAVVIVNIIFSSLAYKKNWYIDLTAEKLYELSDAGRDILDSVEGDIKIHFCAPLDEIEADYYSNMVFELVKQMADEYDNITYDYIDIMKNPSAVTKYGTVYPSNIIVESGTEFRNFALDKMFIFDTEDPSYVWAFDGEKRLISAIVQITQAETPIAYFTSTHGESLSESLLNLFYEAGYEVLPLDLATEEIHEDARLIVICAPKYDFEGISENTVGRKSEIEKIDEFLDGFGNLMVLRDPEAGALPNLDEFLEEWGIAYDNSLLKDPANSLDVGSYEIIGDYAIGDSLGAQVVSDIVSLGTAPKTIVPYASPVNLLFDYKNSRQTSVVLYSHDTAERYVDGKKVEEGKYPLITLTREARIIGNTYHYSNVFVVGSKYFIADGYLDQKYGNQDIIYTMMRYMGRRQVPINLDFKVFEDESLVITTAEAGSWTATLTLVIPICLIAAGIIIFIRRKHA